MIIQVALGVAFGIILAATILRYWSQVTAMAFLILPIVGLIVAGVWLFNNPGILGTLFYLWMHVAYYGFIAMVAVFGVLLGVLVLYGVLLGPCIAYEGIKGERHKNELFLMMVYPILGLLVGGLAIAFLPLSNGAKDVVAYVYLFALLLAPWIALSFGKHSPALSHRFQFMKRESKVDVADSRITPPDQTSP